MEEANLALSNQNSSDLSQIQIAQDEIVSGASTRERQTPSKELATKKGSFRKMLSRIGVSSRSLPPLRNSTALDDFKILTQAPDYQLAGVPDSVLPDFWRGVAIKLAHQLDRTRTECIRISRLKAMSDTDLRTLHGDEGENIRRHCIKIIQLPVNERLLLSAKCFASSQAVVLKGRRRMRLIVMSDHVIFDHAVHGPNVSKNSVLVRLDQVSCKCLSPEFGS